jgi:hypothetical protein
MMKKPSAAFHPVPARIIHRKIPDDEFSARFYKNKQFRQQQFESILI